MAIKTLYLLDTRVASGTNNHLNVQEGGVAPTDAAFATATGWEANSKAIGQSALLASLSEVLRTSADWSATLQPAAVAPNATRGDCWRAGPYTGTFANTAWTLSLVIRSITAAYAGRCRFRWRVWKSANADGSGATQLTAAQLISGATTANLSTTANAAALTASWSPGALTLNDEYLFFQLGIEVTAAGTANTQDVNLRKNGSTAVTTPDFVTATTLALTGVDTDELTGSLTPAAGATTAAFVGVATDETTGSLTTVPGTVTHPLSGVATDEIAGSLTASPVNSPIALSGVATDETVGSLNGVPGTAAAPLSGVVTDEQAGSLTATPGAVNRSLTGANTDESVGTLAAVPQTVTAALTGLSSDETTGSLAAVPGTTTVPLVGVGTDEQIGSLLLGGDGILTLPGVGTDEQAGTLVALPGAVSVSLQGIPTDELLGSVGVEPGEALLSLPSAELVTDELTGALVAVAGDVVILLAGIDTDELIGSPGSGPVIIGPTLPRNTILVVAPEKEMRATREESSIRARPDNEVIRATRGA